MDQNSAHWKRIARTQALRDRVGEWAARAMPAELQAGIRCWLGPHAATEDLVLQGVGFALLAPHGGPSLVARYRKAVGKLPRADRAVLDAWQASWFALCEVTAVDYGVGLRLEDVVTGQSVYVVEPSASGLLQVGDWLACVLMPVDGGVELEGTFTLLVANVKIAAVQAYLREMASRGLERVPPDTSLEFAWEVIRAVRNEQRRPRILNYDRHPIEAIVATLDVSWSYVLDVTDTWEDAVDEDDGAVSILGRHEPELGGRIIVATFRYERGRGVTLEVNSRERYDDVCSRWDSLDRPPFRVIEERVDDGNPDPEGPEFRMDACLNSVPSVAQWEEELLANAVARWLDAPIPLLDGLSPRQAAKAGRGPEVRALLPNNYGEDVVRKYREELGI